MGAGEPSKPLHFYTIGPLPETETDSPSHQAQEEATGTSLVVSQFAGDGIYSETPIVWKNKQHLQRFKYNRWANPPTRMLQEVVVQLLHRESPQNEISVYSATSDVETGPFQVRGNLRNLYLKRMKDTWEVTLNLELTLIKRDSSQDLGGHSISSEDIAGSWILNATGRAEAPSNEQQTPSSMNKLLSDLNQDISENGQKIARSVLKRIRSESNNIRNNEQSAPGESQDDQ